MRLYTEFRFLASRCKRTENFKCADKYFAIIIILSQFPRLLLLDMKSVNISLTRILYVSCPR